MIKLIATDLDGTLLPHSLKELETEVFTIFSRLKKKEYNLTVATGRPYINAVNLFKNKENSAIKEADLFFISDNGGAVFIPKDFESAPEILLANRKKNLTQIKELTQQCNLTELFDEVLVKKRLSPKEQKRALIYPHKLVAANFIDYKIVQELCLELNTLAETELVISTPYSCYMLSRNQDFVNKVNTFLGIEVDQVSDVTALPDEVIKITVYTNQSTIELQSIFKEKWGHIFKVAASGEHWLDFTLSDKGSSLAYLAYLTDTDLSQIMAFGDNYNDVEMLRSVGVAYLMQNAHYLLKEEFPRQCASVLDILREM